MEELREADILWPDADHGDRGDETSGDTVNPRRRVVVVGGGGGVAQRRPSSRPVSIPSAQASSRRPWTPSTFNNYDGGGGGGGDGENDDDRPRRSTVAGEMAVIPPHAILARRTATEEMEFSVCAGGGRTLKGRDLKRLRNSVLRMTGFLETS